MAKKQFYFGDALKKKFEVSTIEEIEKLVDADPTKCFSGLIATMVKCFDDLNDRLKRLEGK